MSPTSASAISSTMDPLSLKESGNEAFKRGDLDEALKFYTEAISLSDTNSNEVNTQVPTMVLN